MSNLEVVYKAMQDWKEQLPGSTHISLFLMPDGFRVSIGWAGDDIMYNYGVPTAAMDVQLDAQNLNAFGDMILSEAEKAYKLHTIGEE